MTSSAGVPSVDRPNLWIAAGLVSLSLLFLPVGVLLIVWDWNEHQREKAAAGWPQSPGTLIYSKVRDLGKTPVLQVRYEYAVNGKVFQSYRYHVSDSYSAPVKNRPDRSENYGIVPDPEGWVVAHPKGATVTVWHDPVNPAFGVLDPAPSRDYSMMLGGAAIITLGLGVSGFLVSGKWKSWRLP